MAFSEARISRLCSDVLNLDDSILAVVLCTREGQIRSTELRKERLPWKNRSFDSEELADLTRLLGPRVSVVIGVADQSSSLFGPLEGVALIYGKSQMLLLDVSEAKMYLVVMLPRSSSIDYMVSKLKELLMDPSA
jgi:hypothetical protein